MVHIRFIVKDNGQIPAKTLDCIMIKKQSSTKNQTKLNINVKIVNLIAFFFFCNSNLPFIERSTRGTRFIKIKAIANKLDNNPDAIRMTVKDIMPNAP